MVEHLTDFINLKDNFAQRFIHKGASPNKRVTIELQQDILYFIFCCVKDCNKIITTTQKLVSMSNQTRSEPLSIVRSNH